MISFNFLTRLHLKRWVFHGSHNGRLKYQTYQLVSSIHRPVSDFDPVQVWLKSISLWSFSVHTQYKLLGSILLDCGGFVPHPLFMFGSILLDCGFLFMCILFTLLIMRMLGYLNLVNQLLRQTSKLHHVWKLDLECHQTLTVHNKNVHTQPRVYNTITSY